MNMTDHYTVTQPFSGSPTHHYQEVMREIKPSAYVYPGLKNVKFKAIKTLFSLPILDEILPLNKNIDFDVIAEQICAYYKEPVKIVQAKNRYKETIRVKHLFCFYSRFIKECSLPKIGRYLDFDHSTVINANKNIYKWLELDMDNCGATFQKSFIEIAYNIHPSWGQKAVQIIKELEK